MKKIKSLIILLSFIVLSCGDKKENKVEESTSIKLEDLHVKQEIKVIEAVTEELKSAEASIEESIKILDELFNEL